uniref:Lipoprotein n=1 Tax=Steinernema glaseri TaxID=37863 RepID=A0A1I7ZXZ1_9BILA
MITRAPLPCCVFLLLFVGLAHGCLRGKREEPPKPKQKTAWAEVTLYGSKCAVRERKNGSLELMLVNVNGQLGVDTYTVASKSRFMRVANRGELEYFYEQPNIAEQEFKFDDCDEHDGISFCDQFNYIILKYNGTGRYHPSEIEIKFYSGSETPKLVIYKMDTPLSPKFDCRETADIRSRYANITVKKNWLFTNWGKGDCDYSRHMQDGAVHFLVKRDVGVVYIISDLEKFLAGRAETVEQINAGLDFVGTQPEDGLLKGSLFPPCEI